MAAICGGLRIHHRACYVNGVSVSRRNFDMKQLGADSSHPDDDATADGLDWSSCFKKRTGRGILPN